MASYKIPDNLKGVTAYTTKGNFVFDNNLSQEDRALLYKQFNYPLVKIDTIDEEETQQSGQSKSEQSEEREPSLEFNNKEDKE